MLRRATAVIAAQACFTSASRHILYSTAARSAVDHRPLSLFVLATDEAGDAAGAELVAALKRLHGGPLALRGVVSCTRSLRFLTVLVWLAVLEIRSPLPPKPSWAPAFRVMLTLTWMAALTTLLRNGMPAGRTASQRTGLA